MEAAALPAAVSLDLNVDTRDDPDELPEAHFPGGTKSIAGNARAGDVV